jgi:putative ATP-grasp target RiPP
MTAGDLDRAGAHFPLGASLGPEQEQEGVRPFGLGFAVVPCSAVELHWEQLGYDPVRQITTVTDEAGTILPAMKHTSTKTKTDTNAADRKPPDDDEDATGT